MLDLFHSFVNFGVHKWSKVKRIVSITLAMLYICMQESTSIIVGQF